MILPVILSLILILIVISVVIITKSIVELSYTPDDSALFILPANDYSCLEIKIKDIIKTHPNDKIIISTENLSDEIIKMIELLVNDYPNIIVM